MDAAKANREYGRARYARLKREGKCPGCRGPAGKGTIYCRDCLRVKRENTARKRRKPPPPEPPEREISLGLTLMDLLEWVRHDPGPVAPVAGPAEQEEEPDGCALAPEIAARAWALRVGTGMPVEDKEGDEFAKWGPSPRTGRMIFSRPTGKR